MIPRTIYEPEHEQFRESVRKFLIKEAVPYHEKWEDDGQVDRDFWLKAGEIGMLSPTVPEAYGGVGADFRYNSVATEELFSLGITGPGFVLHSDIAVPYIMRLASESVKKRVLPGCISGDIIAAIAMTEPNAGSDLQAIKTTAIRDGDDYIINGSKTFITNGQHADVVVVMCKTDPDMGAKGISLFLVERGMPGFARGNNLKKLGMKAQDTAELFFDNVRVPKENLLGAEGKGFGYIMQDLPQERLSIAIGAIALSAEILNQTIDHVKERAAFGKPISTFQNTQFKLAELDTELTSARVFVDRCLELHIQGKLDTATASKAKLLSTELQSKLIDECLQLHGGYGFMWEYQVARAYADSRVHRIYGGTNEIMKLIIGRELLK